MSLARGLATARVGAFLRARALGRKGGGNLPTELYKETSQAKMLRAQAEQRYKAASNKNIVLGLVLGGFAIGVYKYSIWAVREGQDTLESLQEFENIERELEQEERLKKQRDSEQ